jgi:hypothetical protein
MKHAVINAHGHIIRVFDKAPKDIATTNISDAHAKAAQVLVDAGEVPLILGGAVTSRKRERAAGHRLRWDRETGVLMRIPIPVVVPQTVSRRGLRKALRRVGITFQDIKKTVGKLTDEDVREDALVDIEDAQTIRRAHALVALIGQLFSKTEAELDAIFRAAATFSE